MLWKGSLWHWTLEIRGTQQGYLQPYSTIIFYYDKYDGLHYTHDFGVVIPFFKLNTTIIYFLTFAYYNTFNFSCTITNPLSHIHMNRLRLFLVSRMTIFYSVRPWDMMVTFLRLEVSSRLRVLCILKDK